MRPREEFPLEPEVVEILETIDATLAGEAVDPHHSEVAELTLLLAADRPVVDQHFAARLDERVQQRAAPAATRTRRSGRRRRARLWMWVPAGAVAASLAAAVVIVVSEGGGGTMAGAFNGPAASAQHAAHASASRAAPPPRGLWQQATTGSASSSADVPASPRAAQSLQSSSAPETLQAPTLGRKVVQGAQLALSTTPRRVDQVAQEVYNVVGQQNGIVKSSSVTANGGRGGYAQFQLSVPSSNLARAMASLSTLPYAHVASRTDNTQDVTNLYRFDQQHLNDARALHTSLLKQLANALTQAQIDSLQARIRDVEATISRDQAALHSLQRRVGYSQITLTINSGARPAPAQGGGFTLGRAAHDAGRVLTVAAGVALIGLAALVPAGLLLALLWWIWRTLRRRWRLQALELT